MAILILHWHSRIRMRAWWAYSGSRWSSNSTKSGRIGDSQLSGHLMERHTIPERLHSNYWSRWGFRLWCQGHTGKLFICQASWPVKVLLHSGLFGLEIRQIHSGASSVTFFYIVMTLPQRNCISVGLKARMSTRGMCRRARRTLTMLCSWSSKGAWRSPGTRSSCSSITVWRTSSDFWCSRGSEDIRNLYVDGLICLLLSKY